MDRDPGSSSQDVDFCVLASADDVDVAGSGKAGTGKFSSKGMSGGLEAAYT